MPRLVLFRSFPLTRRGWCDEVQPMTHFTKQGVDLAVSLARCVTSPIVMLGDKDRRGLRDTTNAYVDGVIGEDDLLAVGEGVADPVVRLTIDAWKLRCIQE